MIIFGAIILSFLITLGFFLTNKVQYKWWEFFLGTVATTIVVTIFHLIFNSIGQSYTETWGSTVISIYEQEPYNYWVNKTCSREVACGTDADGNTQYCTEYYDCSYQANVGPSWTVYTDLGKSIQILEKQYDSLVIVFDGKRSISNERKNHSPRDRAVHSKGTKFEGKSVGTVSYEYKTDWPGTEATRKAVATQHKYKNKVKSSNLTIFNISLINEMQADSLQLFRYPKLVDNLTYPTILGVSITPQIHENFRKLNGKFGPTNEMRLWVLVFEDKPSIIAKYQENYWVRGNMNELIICIGKKDTLMQWVDVFSWTTNESLKIEIRDYITTYSVLNDSTWDDLYMYLDNNLHKYTRRDFNEFDYLKREIKWWEILISYIFGIGIAIAMNIWCSTNNYHDNYHNHSYKYNKFK